MAPPISPINGWKTIDSLPSKFNRPTVFTTGHNESGQSIIQSQKPSEWASLGEGKYSVGAINTTKGLPVDLGEDADIKSHAELLEKGMLGLVRKGGVVCRMVEFGPSTTHPMMHRTQSFDYGIVLEGSMEMLLDDGSTTTMKRGDVMIQRGTMHAWRNPDPATWARVLFILLDCKPILGPNGKPLLEDLGNSQEWPPSA